MKIAVSTWSLHPWLLNGTLSFEEVVDFLAENGAHGIEIVDIDFHEITMDRLLEMQRYASSKGIMISCLSLEHDLCRLTEEERKADIEKVLKWIEYASKLDVKKLRVFTGWNKNDIAYETQVQWVIDGYKEIVKEASRLGVELVLENHNDVILDADEILALMKRIDSPYLFSCPDVFNYAIDRDGNDPVVDDKAYADIEKLIPYAKNAHIKYCSFLQNGEDKIVDTKRMITLLKQGTYDGYVAIEFMWNRRSADIDIRGELKKGIKLLQKNI